MKKDAVAQRPTGTHAGTVIKKKWPFIKAMFVSGMCLLGVSAGAQPIITSLSSYTAAQGTPVTVSGSGFNTTPSSNAVYFGATRAVVTTASATSLP